MLLSDADNHRATHTKADRKVPINGTARARRGIFPRGNHRRRGRRCKDDRQINTIDALSILVNSPPSRRAAKREFFGFY